MTTAFLAQFLGLFFLFISLGVLFNHDHATKLVNDLVKHTASRYLSAIVPILLGLWVVLTHTNWMGWEIVVTLTGWFLLIIGVFRVWFPSVYEACIAKKTKQVAAVGGAFFLVLGLLLCYVGFVAY